MTTAVCRKCGAFKFGAFCTCPDCGWTPQTEDELTVSLALTEHCLSAEALGQVGDRIRRGENVTVDEDSRRRVSEALRSSGILQRLQTFRATQATAPLAEPDAFTDFPLPPPMPAAPPPAAAAAEPAPPPELAAPPPEPARKPWWRFWK